MLAMYPPPLPSFLPGLCPSTYLRPLTEEITSTPAPPPVTPAAVPSSAIPPIPPPSLNLPVPATGSAQAPQPPPPTTLGLSPSPAGPPAAAPGTPPQAPVPCVEPPPAVASVQARASVGGVESPAGGAPAGADDGTQEDEDEDSAQLAGKSCRADFDYVSSEQDELSLQAGEVCSLLGRLQVTNLLYRC